MGPNWAKCILRIWIADPAWFDIDAQQLLLLTSESLAQAISLWSLVLVMDPNLHSDQ